MYSSNDIPAELLALLLEALDKSPDGLGLFSHDDKLIFSNPAFSSLFDLTPEQATGLSFDEMVRHVHKSPRGLNVDAEDVDEWLKRAAQFRRSSEYRSFEIDLADGRWFLLTEQLVGVGAILILAAEITEKKRSEEKLLLLSERLRTLANTDGLTGVHNRRHFEVLAEREFNRAQRQGKDTCLMLLDADHFKQVNDCYGHHAGDEVLQAISRCLQEEVRDYDILGRVGGEEFAIMLPATDAEQACDIAQRLCHACEQLKYPQVDQALTVTVSIGIAAATGPALELASVSGLMREADNELYKAKISGRNRVCCKSLL